MSESDSVERTADGGYIVEELEEADATEASTSEAKVAFETVRSDVSEWLDGLGENESSKFVPDGSVKDDRLDEELEHIRDALSPATAERGLGPFVFALWNLVDPGRDHSGYIAVIPRSRTRFGSRTS